MTDTFLKNGGYIHPSLQYWNGSLWTWDNIAKDEILVIAPRNTCTHADTTEELTEKLYNEMEDPDSYWNQCQYPEDITSWVKIFGMAGLESKPNRDRAMKAAYIRHSRAWSTPHLGPKYNIAAPMADRINHKPVSLRNSVVLIPQTKEDAISVKAIKDIPLGHPLYISYWENEDVLFKAKQYDFFDDTHGNHAIGTSLSLTLHKSNPKLFDFISKNFDVTIQENCVSIKKLLIRNEDGRIPAATKELCTALASQGQTWEHVYLIILQKSIKEKSPHPLTSSTKLAADWRMKVLRALHQKFSKCIVSTQ